MKKEINILRLFIVVGVISVVSLIIVGLVNKQVNYNELTEVKIKQMGTMIPSGDEYTLTYKDGTWVASYNRIDWFENNVNEAVVDDEFVNNIKAVLKDNGVHKWDDFNIKHEIVKKAAAVVTDGINYSFYMHFSNGRVIKIEEYNTYPKNFMTVFEAFEKQYVILFDE